MARVVKFEGEIKSANGMDLADNQVAEGFAALPTVVTYEAEYEPFGPDKDEKFYSKQDWESALAEMTAAGVKLSTEDIVKAGNAKAKAKARAKAIAEKLDSLGVIKPTLQNSSQMQLKTVYSVYIAQGKGHEEARELAAKAVGAEWES